MEPINGGGSRITTGATDPARVLVVGAGPTGLVTAGLLASAGVQVDIVERNSGPSDEAKAISIDDESLRVIHHAGLYDDVAPILVPGTGTKYFGAQGQELIYARGRAGLQLGYAFKSPFAQPDLERALVAGLRRDSRIRLRFGVEAVSLTQDDHSVTVGLSVANRTEPGSYQYVVGADGGQSSVRRLLAVPTVGQSFSDIWLVVDTIADHHRERYGMHHGSPERPSVIIPGHSGRCRYEFRLLPGEATPGEPPDGALVARLVSPYRTLAAGEVERATVYRFHARVADTWRVGRVFLAGDAAHMMPPFAGQGLNSGIRDADNLAWKVAAVIDGRAVPELLATYESERRPHAEATVKLSCRLGKVVMTTSPRVARARDLAVAGAVRFPPAGRWLSEMRFKPVARHLHGWALSCPMGSAAIRALPGTMLPQPRCFTSDGSLVLLDEVLGPGFAVIGVGCSDTDWALIERLGLSRLDARLVSAAVDDMLATDQPGAPGCAERTGVADADGTFARWCEPLRHRFVLVRPDKFVAAVFTSDELSRTASWLQRSILPPLGRSRAVSTRSPGAPGNDKP